MYRLLLLYTCSSLQSSIHGYHSSTDIIRTACTTLLLCILVYREAPDVVVAVQCNAGLLQFDRTRTHKVRNTTAVLLVLLYCRVLLRHYQCTDCCAECRTTVERAIDSKQDARIIMILVYYYYTVLYCGIHHTEQSMIFVYGALSHRERSPHTNEV